MKTKVKNKVSIVMGSQSDYKTMKYAEKILKKLKINFEKKNYFCPQNTKKNV